MKNELTPRYGEHLEAVAFACALLFRYVTINE